MYLISPQRNKQMYGHSYWGEPEPIFELEWRIEKNVPPDDSEYTPVEMVKHHDGTL